MDTPKKKLRKATPQEKAFYREGMRDIKGKKVKNQQMSDRISKGTGPAGSSTGTQTKAKSQSEASKRTADRLVSFLEETRKGQKLQKKEQKVMTKTGSKSSPKFSPSVVRQNQTNRGKSI